MQLNDNSTLIFSEKPENESVYEDKEIMSSMQTNIAPIILTLVSNVRIPEGYRWSETEPITWETTIDQHLLHIVSTLLRQQTLTQTALYYVRLVGELSYNRILKGFVANNSSVYLETGAAGTPVAVRALTDTAGTVAFNLYGSTIIDEVLGYATSLEQVQSDAASTFSIEIVNEYPSILLPDGTIITYNPANPTQFFSYLDGQSEYTFVVTSTAVITTTLGPNS